MHHTHVTTKQRLSRYRVQSFALCLSVAMWLAAYPARATPAPEQARRVASYNTRAPAYVPYQPPRRGPLQLDSQADRVEEENEDPDSPPHLDLEVATHAPLALGGQLSFELPGRLLIQGSVGAMPSAYGSVIHSVLDGAGVDSAASTVTGLLLEDALVLRAAGGWRPFPSAGFEIYGGYTRIALDATASTAQIRSLSNGALPSQAETLLGTSGIGLKSTLHNVHVAVGWRWVAFDHLVIRANIGYLKTLDSSSEVVIEEQPEIASTATSAIAPVLDSLYSNHVQLPIVGLSAGYRF